MPPQADERGNEANGNQHSAESMSHLQPNLRCRDIGESMRVPPRVYGRDRLRARIRPPGSIRGWKIENGQILVLVTHCRSERHLSVNENRRENSHPEKPGPRARVFFLDQGLPKPRPDRPDQNEQSKKCLRETRVKDSDFIFQQFDSETSEDALRKNGAKGSHSQPAHLPEADRLD